MDREWKHQNKTICLFLLTLYFVESVFNVTRHLIFCLYDFTILRQAGSATLDISYAPQFPIYIPVGGMVVHGCSWLFMVVHGCSSSWRAWTGDVFPQDRGLHIFHMATLEDNEVGACVSLYKNRK